jgi:putative ABC transport system permease protein
MIGHRVCTTGQGRDLAAARPPCRIGTIIAVHGAEDAMFRNYIKTALRTIARHKADSLVNIAGLTVGMACFILIALWVYDETHYDTFHANADRIYRLVLHKAGDPSDPGFPSAPYALPPILKSEFPEIEETVRVRDLAYPSPLRYGDVLAYEPRFFLADASFFTVFSHKFLDGDPATALADPGSVVLTRAAAAKYFGDVDPMGKVMRWNNAEDLRVTGIVENVPYNSNIRFDFVGSIELCGHDRITTWTRETSAYILLRKGAARQEVEAKIRGTILEHQPDDNYILSLESLPEAYLTLIHGGGSDKRLVLIFAVIAVAVLAIACVNFTNLSTARSSARALEVGVRKVVGARRSDIVRQFLGEALIFSFIALALALAFVDMVLPGFNRSQGKELSLLGSGSLPLCLFLVAIAVVTGLAAGGYPAFYLSSFKPAGILKKMARRRGRGPWLRTALVIGQFAAAVVMIVLTLTARRQMSFILTSDLGFDRERIVHILVNDDLRTKFELFKERVLAEPGVVAVTASSAPPHLTLNVNDFTWEGRGDGPNVEVNCLYVDPDYARTFGLGIVEGRDFARGFPASEREAFLVNQATVRFMGMADPLGKRVTLAGETGTIVGVVKDFNHLPLLFNVSPLVMAVRPERFHDLLVKVGPQDIPRTLAGIERVFKDTTPGFPFEYKFLDEEFATLYKPLNFVNRVFDTFAVLALFISGLGLIGLASLLTEQRTKEVGIRKVMGASAPGLVALLSGRFFSTVLAANVIAAPLAYWATQAFLGLFVFRVPFDGLALLAAAAATFAIALGSVGAQVFRTARLNPVDCLRYE